MPLTPALAAKAAKNARAAMRAGDVVAARRWLDLAERTVTLMYRFDCLAPRATRVPPRAEAGEAARARPPRP